MPDSKRPSDSELRVMFVGLGSAMGVQRYTGQHPTAAAREFADRAMAIVKELEARCARERGVE